MERLFSASSSYTEILDQYKRFIKNPEEKSSKMSYLLFKETESGRLKIEVFGKKVELDFSLVFDEKKRPLGQVSVFLIKHQCDFSSLKDVTIDAVWFDKFGNAKFNIEEEKSTTNINQDGFFKEFITRALIKLLESDEFSPYKPN